MWRYTHSNELYHWGIKGMKWGVRRYQNKDGTLTPAGQKRYSTNSAVDITSQKETSRADRSALAKKLADRDFTTNKKRERLNAEYDKSMEELQDKFDKLEVRYRSVKSEAERAKLDKEYDELSDKADKIYSKYADDDLKLDDATREEESDLRKSVFLADDVKPSVLKARELHKSLDKLYDETAGQGSKAYKDAFEKYVKSLNDPDMIDDADYGFDHYYWPDSKEQKQAVKEYESKVSSIRKEYTDLTISIGKKVTEGFGDQKMSDNSWFKNYEDWGRNEVDEIIRLDRLNL